jgi:hypothetical protein
MPSSRRALLTGVGAALTGLAGCLDASNGSTEPTDSPSSTPTVTTTPTPTAVPAEDSLTLGDSLDVDGVTVTVSDFVTTHSVRYLTAPDAMGVAATENDQFAFVDVSVRGEGRPPAPHRFALVADGTGYGSGLDYVGPARVDAPVTGHRYDDSNREGYVAFRVPAPLDAESVAVILGDRGPETTDMQSDTDGVRAAWSIPPSLTDALRSPPPAFSTRIEVPESVAADEVVPVRIDVTNEGEGVGTFHGAINHQGPLYAADSFSVSLPPGESTTHEATVGYYRGSDSPPERVQFGVVGPGVSESFSVSIESGGTPSGTATATDTPT